MPRTRITNNQIDWYIHFLDELNYIVESMMITDPLRDTEFDILRLWVNGITVDHSLHNRQQKIMRWKVLSRYFNINEKHLLGTFRSTKFVQYTDFSLRNFLLWSIKEDLFPVKATKIYLPDHVDLKRFWVPEDLIIDERQCTIYEADWLK